MKSTKIKNPKPIRLSTNGSEISIHIIGKTPKDQPYLSITADDANGFIEDRDIKRLLNWCEKCLKGMK